MSEVDEQIRKESGVLPSFLNDREFDVAAFSQTIGGLTSINGEMNFRSSIMASRKRR